MSTIIATVLDIQSCDSLNIVKFDSDDIILTMMSLELNENITIGTKVKLTVKPTHVAIAKNFSGELSYSNQFKTTIVSCENGQLLCSLKLQYLDLFLESIITLNSSKKLNLKVGDEVTALIKASELSISEVL